MELLGIIHTDLEQRFDTKREGLLTLYGIVSVISTQAFHASKSHSFRYQRNAENEVKLKGNGCTKGLAEIPLNYAVEWAHPHSHISTIHVWAVSSSPQAILTRIHTRLHRPLCSYILTSPLQPQSSRCLALNTLSITRVTWLTLTLIISPLELPILRLEWVTVCNTNSPWSGFLSAGQWAETKWEDLNLSFRSPLRTCWSMTI